MNGSSASTRSPPCRSISASAGSISSVKTWWASWSENVPSGSPGKQRFRFLPSGGEMNGVRVRNAGRFTIGTATTDPASWAGSRPHDPHDGRDRRVLAAVDAAQDAQPRPVVGAGHLEARPLQVAQGRRVEPQHAPGHSPSPRVRATMVTNVR